MKLFPAGPISRPGRVRRWLARLTEIRDLAAAGPRAGQAIRQRHGVALTLEKLRRQPAAEPSAADALLGRIAREIPAHRREPDAKRAAIGWSNGFGPASPATIP